MNLTLTAKYKSIVDLRTIINYLYVWEIIFQETWKSGMDRPYHPPDMQKDNFLHQPRLSQRKLPEKVRKLQKSKSQ